jgi:hypothetical protein
MTATVARSSPNLLVLLYRLAHRQQENFVTEAFSHLLQHLLEYHPRVALSVLRWLTTPEAVAASDISAALTVRTQVVMQEFGIPDLRVEGPDLDMVIEVKLDSGISYEQAFAYRRELEARGRARRTLVALVGYPPAHELPPETHVRTWGELVLLLIAEAERTPGNVLDHLVEQFAGLLNYLHLTPLQVRSPISQGLLSHRAWADKNPDAQAVTRTRIKRIARLRDMPGCESLTQLLLQLDYVLRHSELVPGSYKFDSAPHMARPWIGFNLNDGDYFLFVSLNSPERITLQRYRGGVDPASFDGALGELDIRADRIIRWRVSLDLCQLDPDFFTQPPTTQVKILSDFVENGLVYGQTLRRQTPGREVFAQ